MRKAIYPAVLFVLAAAAVTFAALYYRQAAESRKPRAFHSNNRVWLLSGDEHLFEVTERTFDADGLFGFVEGRTRWTRVGGPHTLYSGVFVGAELKSAISDEEEIIGVLNGTTATAYPLRVLAHHQVVNDETQEPPVLVYYGNNSRTAAAFQCAKREAGLCFGCTGFLYKNVDLLYDLATESLFLPMTGSFVAGQRLGESVAAAPSAVMTLAEWRKLYPSTRVMTENTGVKSARYPREDVLGKPFTFRTRFKADPLTPSRDIEDAEPVIAVSDGWERAVVPFSPARRAGRREVSFDLAGKEYTAHFTEDFKWAWVTDASGRLAPSMRTLYRIYVSIRRDAAVVEAR